MKKFLVWVLALLLLLLLLIIGAYVGLHTKYAPSLVNNIAKVLMSEPIQVNQVEYSYKTPRHLILSDISFGEQSDSAYIPNIEILFAATLVKNGQLHFKRLSINDMKIQSIEKLPFDKFNFYVDEMWLNNAQLETKTPNANNASANNIKVSNISAENINLHIKNPSLTTKNAELPFYGEFNLTADKLSYQNEVLTNLSIAGDLSSEQSQISSLTFQWQQKDGLQGRVYVRAQQTPEKKWRFDKIKLTNLLLTQEHLNLLPSPLTDFFLQKGVNIDQLTIINSSLALDRFELNKLNIEASNLSLPFSLWQQNNFTLTGSSAEAIWDGYFFSQSNIELAVKNKTLTLTDLNLQTENGGITAQGEFSPTHITLDDLSITRLNWYPSTQSQQAVMDYLNGLQSMDIGQLSLNAINAELNSPLSMFSSADNANSQSSSTVQTDPEQAQNEQDHLMQLTGLDINGEQVTLKQQNRWSLWQGKLQINAENIDYQDINSKLLQVSLHAENGHVWANQLIAPINDGLLQGTGDINLSQKTQPWQFDVEMTGLPLSLIQSLNPLNFTIDGIIDGKMNANGLSGDASAFQYSVTGELEANISQASTTANLDKEWQQDQNPDTLRNIEKLEAGQAIPIEISNPVHINIDRGRVNLDTLTISSPHYMMLMDIQHDFLKPDDSQFNYRLRQSCDVIETMMQSPEVQALYEDLCSQ